MQNCFGCMTKMAMLPIYGKNPLNIFFPESGMPMTLGLGNLALGMCSPTRFAQINTYSRLTLTYFMSRSNFISNALKFMGKIT